jgi:CBS domain-containing protein
MSQLTLRSTKEVHELIWPIESEQATLASSALDIFTDFSKTRPLVIDADIPAQELVDLMRKAHVKLKIVLGRAGEFVGIISLADLEGPKKVKKIAEGATLADLVAGDLMKPKCELKAFQYDELEKSSIGDVVEMLKQIGEQHCLVVDDNRVRGVISASDIARKLNIDIDLSYNTSFVKLYLALK